MKRRLRSMRSQTNPSPLKCCEGSALEKNEQINNVRKQWRNRLGAKKKTRKRGGCRQIAQVPRTDGRSLEYRKRASSGGCEEGWHE
eukprot:1694427-Amphidinium_carterae.1